MTEFVGRRTIAAYALLIAGNVAAWLWAFAEFRDRPVLLGSALLAYSFGLRHGFDADHIAAIDNVTRKLIEEGRRPIFTGLFFALGHSTVVVALSVAIASAAASQVLPLEGMREMGGLVGSLVSALFLFAIAAANLTVLAQIWRARPVAGAAEARPGDAPRTGFLARLARPVFALVGRSWHMYPVGFLFGLGFDTATEIGLLAVAATNASHGLPVSAIVVFPALFTAGMSLVDMTDSILMVRAYGWAVISPARKLYYNLAITSVSIAVAFLLGGIELLGLISAMIAAHTPFFRLLDQLSSGYELFGYAITGFFLISWLVSFTIFKAKRADRPGAPLVLPE